MSVTATVFLLLFGCHLCNSYRILCVFIAPSKSHFILGSSYVRGLADAGHDVTFISPYKYDKPTTNGSIRSIVLTGFEEYRENLGEEVNLFKFFDYNCLLPIVMFYNMGYEMTEKTLAHANVQKLIMANESFDLVVVEHFVNDALKVLAYHYNAPLIIFSPTGASSLINPLIGNPYAIAYQADMVLGYPDVMTSFERSVNLLYNYYFTFLNNLLFLPKQNSISQKYFLNAPYITEILANTSLVLLNSDPSIDIPVPKVPTMVDIGGYYIKPPKPLPSDLKQFLDDAKEGVIYFSLGSHLKSNSMPIQNRDDILKVFAKLKQKVLWKWEDDKLLGKPDNVKIEKWVPQQDILAHPNIKLFITQGGLLSQTESIYHGVPVISIPIIGDQIMNGRRAEINGFGLMVPFTKLTQESLSMAVYEILSNPKYRENAKRRSQIMHDKPMKPLDAAIFWTEYVIRNKGSQHLRIAGLDLSWYQYYLLDVYAFIVTALFAVIYILKYLFRKIYNGNFSTLKKIKNN